MRHSCGDSASPPAPRPADGPAGRPPDLRLSPLPGSGRKSMMTRPPAVGAAGRPHRAAGLAPFLCQPTGRTASQWARPASARAQGRRTRYSAEWWGWSVDLFSCMHRPVYYYCHNLYYTDTLLNYTISGSHILRQKDFRYRTVFGSASFNLLTMGLYSSSWSKRLNVGLSSNCLSISSRSCG